MTEQNRALRMKQELQAYRKADTMGKSSLELILMVYDGAIKALRTAADHYARNENQAGYDQIQDAKRMVTHLYATLDNVRGGEIAANLGKVYSWAIAQMQLIEATRDIKQVETVVQALNNLRSGWAELNLKPTVSNEGVRSGESKSAGQKSEHVLTTA